MHPPEGLRLPCWPQPASGKQVMKSSPWHPVNFQKESVLLFISFSSISKILILLYIIPHLWKGLKRITCSAKFSKSSNSSSVTEIGVILAISTDHKVLALTEFRKYLWSYHYMQETIHWISSPFVKFNCILMQLFTGSKEVIPNIVRKGRTDMNCLPLYFRYPIR